MPIEAGIFRDDVAATPNMAYFGPYRAKMGFAASTVLHDVYSGFNENLSILKKKTDFANLRLT